MAALMPLDAFCHRGMGASGAKVFSVLAQAYREGEGALIAKQVQERASASKATCARKLKDFIAYGLVDGTADTYVLTEYGAQLALDSRTGAEGWREYWESVAELRGVKGTMDRRMARHELERAEFHKKLITSQGNPQADIVPDRGDSVPEGWAPGDPVVDPRTGEVWGTDDMVVDSRNRLYIPSPELSYDELMELQRQAMQSEHFTNVVEPPLTFVQTLSEAA